MDIQNLLEAKEIFNSNGAVGKLLNSFENLEFVHLTIEPGSSIAAHSLPNRVYFYIISGKGLLTLENQSFDVKKDNLLFVSPNKSRSWENNSEEILKILVVKELN